MGRWWLFVKEGFILLRRNRTAWFIVQCMMIAAVGVTGILAEIAIHIDTLESKFIQGFTLESFCDVTADATAIQELKIHLANLPLVDNVHFVSREEAAQRFRESIGVDLLGTLNENPLPPSFRITFNPTCTVETLDSLADVIAKLPGTDEVVYPREMVFLLGSIRSKVNSTGLAVASGIALLAFVLTTVMLRLSIHSEKDKIQVMALLGASRTMIRIPFLLAGIILGAVGGFVAALIVAGITTLTQYYFQMNFDQGLIGYVLMVAGGMVWGFLASSAAVIWGIRSA